MYKNTKRKLQKKAIYYWQQDMDKFIVFPLSWGFFNVEEWSLVQQFRPYWTLYWHPFPGAILSVNGTDFEPDPETIYLFPPYTKYSGKYYQSFIQFAVHFLAESPFDRVVNKMLKIPAENISKSIMKPFSSLIGLTLAYLIALNESATTDNPAIPNAINLSTLVS